MLRVVKSFYNITATHMSPPLTPPPALLVVFLMIIAGGVRSQKCTATRPACYRMYRCRWHKGTMVADKHTRQNPLGNVVWKVAGAQFEQSLPTISRGPFLIIPVPRLLFASGDGESFVFFLRPLPGVLRIILFIIVFC